jgi:hypothetical protein
VLSGLTVASEDRLATRLLARLRLHPTSPNVVVTIMQRQMLSLAVIVLFLLPLLPSPPSAAPATLSGEPGNSEIETPDSFSATQPVGEAAQTAASKAEEPTPVELPGPPEYQEFTASPRAAALWWNRTRVFNNCNQSTDFAVTGEVGMLYYEVNNFTRITTNKLKIVVENYNWRDPSLPALTNLSVNQPLLIGFRIPPDRVAIDGFWVLVLGPSNGILNFTIYRAKAGIAPAITQPDFTAPVRWPAMQYVIPSVGNLNRTWVWLDTNESSLFLDGASTYANTYYLALWRPAASSKVQPIFAFDAFWPDSNDESDSYIGWTPLRYLCDFFLNVSVIRYPYPTNVAMKVNGMPVRDIGGQPGKGTWDNFPGFNMTGATRSYNVTSSAPMLFFDVAWFGRLYSTIAASTLCRVWANRPTVDWEIQFNAAFPSPALSRLITVSIETDWNVSAVHLNGVPFLNWKEEANYVRISNALSGSWLIACKAPDYAVAAEVRNFLGEVITEANASDQVIVRGYLHDPLEVSATNGSACLLVYDPHDVVIVYNIIDISPPGGIADFGWWIWEKGTGAGKYVLQVLWSNGTEAGMAVTVLTVHSGTNLIVTYQYPASPGEPIVRGEKVLIQVYYYYDEFKFNYSVDNAIVEVYNGSIAGGVYWPDYDWYNYASSGYPGYYIAYVPTDSVIPGILNNVTMRIFADYSEEQSYPKQFMIKTKVTRIVFFWNGNPLPGLTNTSPTDWRTSPEPYLNDSSLQFTIMYTDESGFPLQGAQLSPFIVVNGTNQYKRLNWIDLSDIDSSRAGLYNISIDTNPIGATTLHEGDVCYIVIYAYIAGYESTWSSPVWVRPRPRPSWIDVPTQYRAISLFINWTYTSALRVVLRDALTGDDLSFGSLNAYIYGLGNVSLDLATPGLGLYEIGTLNTANIPIGTHNVTIYATARDFTPSTFNVSLTITPKNQIGYTIEQWFYQELQPNLGTRCILAIRFTFAPGLASGMAMCSHTWYGADHQRLASDPLPEDTKVTLDIKTSKGNFKSVYLYVNATGHVLYAAALEFEGDYSFYVSIAATEEYAEVSDLRLERDGTALTASIVSSLSYLAARLPFYALVAALAIVIPLGSYLGYRQAVVLPRKRRRLAKYQSIADTFSDVANLNRLLVLHKESGICVFDPFSEETKDATLVAGFLQAISTFGHDLVESPGLAGKDKEQASTLRELTYEGFRILIHDGQFVRNALVLSGKPSDQLRERLERFTGEFEKRYRKDFDHWSGRVDQFNSASDLVEEIFLVSLRLPHRVQARRPRGVTLNPLEEDLYKLAKELTKDREYLFLGQILSTYLITAKHNKLEALMGIYQLRNKGLLVPWQLDTTMTAASEGAENGAQ